MKSIAQTAMALLLLTILMPTAQAQSSNQMKKASATLGGNTGGGGSELVAEFVRRAKVLMTRLEVAEPNNRDIITVKNLLFSDRLKIHPRTVLLDVDTNTPILEQDCLLAWGSPGIVQLKIKDWDEAFKTSKNMDHHIFHELCRAAAPECDDESYRISVVQLKLAPEKYDTTCRKSTYDELLAKGVESLKGRNAEAPMRSFEECIHGSNHKVNAIVIPSTTEEILISCRQVFKMDASVRPFIFASDNILVGIDSIRNNYNKITAWYKGDAELNKETVETAQRYANNQAIAICRRYAINEGHEPKNCKILTQFATEHVFPDRRNPNFAFNGGYVARSLAILEK